MLVMFLLETIVGIDNMVFVVLFKCCSRLHKYTVVGE